MLLESIKLKNIRSYTEQIINFPSSSILLAGDIGSGKSTLLLAIEFALFGLSPELSGEALLRKGAAAGSVELAFRLENQEIVIQRSLKKAKDAINQAPGYLIINHLKKELTPSELKAEIIHLLHYPEEFIPAKKNYLFRYTLYCPQEEMRLILQEEPDKRLDLLRKIFNLDKYKKIRENLEFYLKQIRTRQAVLQAQLSPLEPKKSRLDAFRQQQAQLEQELNQLLPALHQAQQSLQTQKQQLSQLEQKNQLHLQLKNQLANLQSILREKENQSQLLIKKQSQLAEKISLFPFLPAPEQLRAELSSLQHQHQQFLSQKSALQARLCHCQEKVLSLQKEISQLNGQTAAKKKKEEEGRKLQSQLSRKEILVKEKEKTGNSLEEIKQSLHQSQLLLSQAQQLKEKISQIDQCPTCLQPVPPQHKEQVFQSQQSQISQLQKQIQELEEKRLPLQQQFSQFQQQLDSLLQKENLLTRLQTELASLEEKQQALEDKKSQLSLLTPETNFLMGELDKLKPETLESLSRQLSQKQELLQKAIQKQEWEKNLAENRQSWTETNSQQEKLSQEKQHLEQKLQETPDLTAEIAQQKELLEESREKEKTLLLEKTRLRTQKENFQLLLDSLIKEIDQLNQYQTHLFRLSELHHWLEEFLIKLTYTIEKQLMLKIHRLFNDLFREWFSLLVEDENFSARLDEAFTPLIEQNGYEIYFSHLSGGERTAASLAYRLALNKVINDIVHEIKTKDLLILDEPTDGFSSEQLDKVREVLDKLNLQQIIIVSHESKIESFVDNVVRIVKSEGVSRII